MNDVKKLLRLQAQTGYGLFRVNMIRCKAHLPAAVWRSLARAEREGVSPEVSIVAVEDGAEAAVVMPTRHYNEMLDRIRELERWVSDLVVEEQTA